jgi:hypothetical protein
MITLAEYKEKVRKAHLEWYTAFAILAAMNIFCNCLVDMMSGLWSALSFFIGFMLFRMNALVNRGTAWATWVLYSMPVYFGIIMFREWIDTDPSGQYEFFLGFVLLGAALVLYLFKVAKVRQLNRIWPLFAKLEATS